MAALTPTLPSVAIGRYDLEVTKLIFGGAPIGGLFTAVSDEAAQATLEAAWAAGIRTFDTAPHYGVGLSERRLGDFLADRPRAEFALCTKVGRLLVPTDQDVAGVDQFYGTPRLARVRDYGREGVIASLEASLERLGVDRVDLALIHDPDEHEQQREALEQAYPALEELRGAGVLRAIGFAMNYTAPLERFVRETDLDCILVAGRCSLLDASALHSLLPECARRGVAVLVAGVFGSGVLADPRPGARYNYAPASEAVIERATQIRAICASYGVSLRAAAMRFPLRHPEVSAIVVGARSPQEIREDLTDFHASVPDALFDEIAALDPVA
jgi:D-threo-aldose 1-dehydrogenase